MPSVGYVVASLRGDNIHIYKIVNKKNGKVYIGQTSRPIKTRLAAHIRSALNGEYRTRFTDAINEFGPECFYIETIDEAETQAEANEKEKYWIARYNSCVEGYNMSPGGFRCGGNTYAHLENLDEIKKKLSDSKMGGKNPMATRVIMTDIVTCLSIIFPSMQDAANYLGLSSHMPVSRRCRKYTKCPLFGRYLFDYLTNEGVTTMENAQNAQ